MHIYYNNTKIKKQKKTHNKNLNLLLNLLINCISARSVPQILSIESCIYCCIGQCTFLLLNVLIIGLCNFANSLLDIISFLTVLPKVFLSKNL